MCASGQVRCGARLGYSCGISFENGWEDKEFIRTRVWGMEQIREEVAKWNPEEVERVPEHLVSSLRALLAPWPTTVRAR